MADITEIMDMLDWNMSSEIQAEGIALARDMESIVPFIQPLTPRHNKNVWDNCAVNISFENARKCKDEVWESNLSLLLQKQ